MYSRPSSSTKRAPRPSRTKTGVPPTATKARTGEFTPPGMSSSERSKSARLRSYIAIASAIAAIERGEGARGGRDILRLEDRRYHREHVGSGLDDARRVLGRDSSDGGDRQARGLRRRGDGGELGAPRVRLGRRGEHASHRDVVRTRRARVSRAPRIVVARYADDQMRQQAP